jgi:hypothetical protein
MEDLDMAIPLRAIAEHVQIGNDNGGFFHGNGSFLPCIVVYFTTGRGKCQLSQFALLAGPGQESLRVEAAIVLP